MLTRGYSPNQISRAVFQSYMDDRTWTGTDLLRSIDRADCWVKWSDTVGLREKYLQNKSLCHPVPKLRKVSSNSAASGHSGARMMLFRFLVLVWSQVVGRIQSLKKNLTKAFSRTWWIRAFPLSFHLKLAIFKKLVLTVASLGWGSRKPPDARCNAFFQCADAHPGQESDGQPDDQSHRIWGQPSPRSCPCRKKNCQGMPSSGPLGPDVLDKKIWYPSCHLQKSTTA